MNPLPSPLMRTDGKRLTPEWFDGRKFRRDLGIGLMGACGLYAAFLLLWATR